MGGTVDRFILSGTASGYPDLHELAKAVEVERTEKTALKIICVHDMWANDEDGIRYWVQRDFAVLPDQIVFEWGEDAPPEPIPRVMYCTASNGLKIRTAPVDGTQVGSLRYGDAANVVDSDTAGWLKIADGLFKGDFVSASWMSVDRP